MEKVTVEVSSWQVRLVRSPIYWIAGTLTGVFFTFGPLFLCWAGQEGASITS